MDHNHGAMQSTPWNVNLDYAVDWSVALGVPVVLLTVRHLFLSISRAIEDRRQGGQGHALLATVDSTEVETDELGVDIPTRYSFHPLPFLSHNTTNKSSFHFFFFLIQSRTSFHPTRCSSIIITITIHHPLLFYSLLMSYAHPPYHRSPMQTTLAPFDCSPSINLLHPSVSLSPLLFS